MSIVTIALIGIGALLGYIIGKESKQPIVYVLIGAVVGFGADYMFGAQLDVLVAGLGRGGGISLPSGGGGGLGGSLSGLFASALPWIGLAIKILAFYFGGKKEKEFSVLAGIAASIAVYTAFEWALNLIPGLSPARAAMADSGATDILGIIRTTLGFAGSWFTSWPFL